MVHTLLKVNSTQWEVYKLPIGGNGATLNGGGGNGGGGRIAIFTSTEKTFDGIEMENFFVCLTAIHNFSECKSRANWIGRRSWVYNYCAI